MDVTSRNMEAGLKKLILILLISLMISACTSLTEAPLATNPIANYIGENVKITTISGETLEFKVENATELTLSGEGQSVNISDIQMMEVRKFSAIKSITLSGALYILSGIVIGSIALMTSL